MKLRRNVSLSLRALFTHRLRTTLALSSVSVGVAALALTSALGKGAQRDVQRSIQSMGVNLLVVRPVAVKRFVGRREFKGTVTTLRMDDFGTISELPLVSQAAPAIEGSVKVKAGASSMITMIRGTTPAYLTIRRFEIRSGRFLDDEDDESARRVVVLGARVAGALFDDDPVGHQIWIRGIPFDVIGVLAPKGALADGDQDNQVVVPVRTALRRVFNSNSLSIVFVSAKDVDSTATAEAEIASILQQRHRDPDFEIQNAARFFAMQRAAADTFTRFGTILAAIALLVGGTGIMGLMLLSVKERTGEIGLRMAVGARPRDILIQLLFEASALSLGGWIAGMLLGALGAAIVKSTTGWQVAAPAQAILASFAMAVSIGLGFGTLPARKAAAVAPVRALLSR